MADDTHSLLLFNLDTMSGVSPGVRTQIMQRVQLQAASRGVAGHDSAGSEDGGSRDGGSRWARFLWYADASAQTQATDIDGATCVIQPQAAPGADRWEESPLAVLENVTGATLNRDVRARLAEHGVAARVCGACVHWQADGIRLANGVPAGLCTVRIPAAGREPATEPPATPPQLARQSLFSPACAHWDASTQPASTIPASASADARETVAALPRAAVLEKEEEAAAKTLKGRLRALFGKGTEAPAQALTWEERLVERSGVGAGTEPCIACQGRIANLGALTVDTDEGDKHTYSVWRCRACQTTYLNSWIDRWERLDNLETEETYYRIAPVEAVEILAVIDGVAGGEHPAGRHTRAAERAWFEAFVAGRRPLSHQRKQGR